MESDEDMNRDLDLVFERATLVDRELDVHASAIAGASDLDALSALETKHRDAMGPTMDEMDHRLADMTQYCRHRRSSGARITCKRR